jgi:TPR repeat protein
MMLEAGHGVAINHNEAGRRSKTAADLRDPDAQVRFGQLCERGMFGVRKDDAEAARYYRMAADQGSPEGAYRLARILRNNPDSLPHWRFAADQGNQEAMIAFAEICEFWRSGQRVDIATAARYYRKASDRGNLNGIHRLATMYEEGCGVQRDILQAIRLYRSLIN